VYVASMKDDYTLFDALNFLGIRLYGPEWTGNEVWQQRVEDPTPSVEARAPLIEEVEQICTELSAKQRESKEIESRADIQRLNSDIDNLSRRRNELYHQLHTIGDVHDSKIRDHEDWVRFELAEGKLLKALRNDELRVVCLSGSVVKPELWAKVPDGFGYDLVNSLIFLPSRESSIQMSSGQIRQKQFEDWLETVIPIVPHEGASITDEQKAYIWLKEKIPLWDGKTTRDQFKEMATAEYPKLGARAFKRIWDALAIPAMKRPGAKKLA